MNDNGTIQTIPTNRSYDLDFDPSWSPDGEKIAFTSTRDGNVEVYVMNAEDGSEQTNISNNPDDIDFDPSWSPDDEKIAFTSSKDGNHTDEAIYTMNANGTN